MAKKETAKLEKALKSEKALNFAEISMEMVNGVKALRAYNAVIGKGKGGSAEVVLVQKLAGEFPDRAELVVEVYKGLGGLVNEAKAKINRVNEAKERARKASK